MVFSEGKSQCGRSHAGPLLHLGSPPSFHCFQRGLAVVRDVKARADTSPGLSQWVSALRGPAASLLKSLPTPTKQGRMLHGEHRSQWKTPLQHPIAVGLWLPGNPPWWKHQDLWQFPNLLPKEYLEFWQICDKFEVGLWSRSGFGWQRNLYATIDFHCCVCVVKFFHLSIYPSNVENFISTFKYYK